MNTYSDFEKFQPELSENETVLMRLKPNRPAYMQLRRKTALSKMLRNLPVLLFPVLGFFLISSQYDQGIGETLRSFGSLIKQFPVFIVFLCFVILVLFFPGLKDIITSSRGYSNTAYFITDKRIIFFAGHIFPIETSIRYNDIDRIQVIDSPQHTSSIYIIDTEHAGPYLSTYGAGRNKVMSQLGVLHCLDNGEMVTNRIYTEVRKYKNID